VEKDDKARWRWRAAGKLVVDAAKKALVELSGIEQLGQNRRKTGTFEKAYAAFVASLCSSLGSDGKVKCTSQMGTRPPLFRSWKYQ
jgi:hypothetical protein